MFESLRREATGRHRRRQNDTLEAARPHQLTNNAKELDAWAS